MKRMKRLFRISINSLLGPYDIEPLFSALAVGLVNQVRLRQTSYSYHYGVDRVRFFLIGSALDIVISFIFYCGFFLLLKFRPKRSSAFSNYMLRIFIIALMSNLTDLMGSKFLIHVLHLKNFLLVDNFISLLVLKFLFALVLVAVTHSRSKVLEMRLAEADKLNNMLSARYTALVETDEEIRDQAAKLLHDRIQGELMLAAARLSRTVQGLPADAQEEIVPVIKVLEKIRSTDVRQVTQLLIPNLASEGLIGACETLCEGFNSEIEIELQISRGIEMVDENIKLGLFRIIEQGLMNSIKHGPASHVKISVSIDHSETIHAEIADNGPGSASEKAGKGSQIIDAWVAILGGFKDIETQLGRGYTLRVSLPINQPMKSKWPHPKVSPL
jgi:signal transduction histidine kinase